MTHLQRLLELAQLYNMEYYIAQAHRFLGEYHISQGQPSDATPLLIKALNIFHSINDIPNREQVRNLAAISAGTNDHLVLWYTITYLVETLSCPFLQALYRASSSFKRYIQRNRKMVG